MTTLQPRLVVVDDHQLFRDGLVALLQDGFDIVGAASTSKDARDLISKLTPDLVLLDVELNDQPAESTLRAIRRLSPSTRVVILTMFDDNVLARRLTDAGAHDYVTKASSPQELKRRLFRALNCPTRRDSSALRAESRSMITAREHEVLRLIAMAASNKAIAAQLCITEGTVKRHTNSLYVKLGAVSRIDAVRLGRTHGLL